MSTRSHDIMLLGAVLLALTLLMSGCRQDQSTTRKATPVTATPAERKTLQAVRLPEPQDRNHDPLAAWVYTLNHPRLSTVAGLSWKCSSRDGNIVLDLKPFDIDCRTMIPLNSAKAQAAKLKLLCLDEHQLRITTEENCSLLEGKNRLQNEVFSQLHLPESKALYIKNQDSSGLVPNTESFPSLARGLLPFEWVASSEKSPDPHPDPSKKVLELRHPSVKTWLAQLQEGGAVVFEIHPLASDSKRRRPNGLAELHELMNEAPKPASFRFKPELHEARSAVSERQQGQPFFRLRADEALPSFYQEVCRYLDQWLVARQLLANKSAQMTQNFSCQFRWAEDFHSQKKSYLEIAKLPLPLRVRNTEVFPIRSSEDARSLTVLQGFKNFE